MIGGFKHRGLKRLYERGDRGGIRPDLLEAVNGFWLPRFACTHSKATLKGLWSVTVRANWRVVFRFEGTDAFDVELIDYH
jgi:toxin HigB-1